VDDLAVARAGAGANCAFRFEDDHFATGKREGSGACQADTPAPMTIVSTRSMVARAYWAKR